MKPRILDCYSKAGGAAMGYYRAGFDVTCLDIEPQPNCPFDFIQADALEYLAGADLSPYAAVHASPNCQGYTSLKALHGYDYPRHIGVVRALLQHRGCVYVIENVKQAIGAMRSPVQLCGSAFGLNVWRHRLFETSFPITLVPPCAHHLQPEPVDVTGTGARRLGPRVDGKGGNSRKPHNLAHAREVMGIDWMTREELSQAIPPAYTEFIGSHLIAHLSEVAA